MFRMSVSGMARQTRQARPDVLGTGMALAGKNIEIKNIQHFCKFLAQQ